MYDLVTNLTSFVYIKLIHNVLSVSIKATKPKMTLRKLKKNFIKCARDREYIGETKRPTNTGCPTKMLLFLNKYAGQYETPYKLDTLKLCYIDM